jgi:type II secretory pathway pseudopilin PulG
MWRALAEEAEAPSPIELLIVVAIIAAIAIPNLMRARMSAKESSAAGSIRTINTGQVSYATIYPSICFSSNYATWVVQPLAPQPRTRAALATTFR